MDDDHPHRNGDRPRNGAPHRSGDRPRNGAPHRSGAPHRNGDRQPAGDGHLPAALLRLRDRWAGLYSITCQDGIWSAYYLRTAEEFDAKSPRALDAKISRDYERRLEIRPGAPERMST